MNYLEIKERVAKDFENYQSRYLHMLEVVDMALKINKYFNFPKNLFINPSSLFLFLYNYYNTYLLNSKMLLND